MANNPAPRPPDWLIGTALLLRIEQMLIGATWTFMVISVMTIVVVVLALVAPRHGHGGAGPTC